MNLNPLQLYDEFVDIESSNIYKAMSMTNNGLQRDIFKYLFNMFVIY